MDEGLKMWQEKVFACDVDLTSVTEEGKKQKQTRKLSALMLVWQFWLAEKETESKEGLLAESYVGQKWL